MDFFPQKIQETKYLDVSPSKHIAMAFINTKGFYPQKVFGKQSRSNSLSQEALARTFSRIYRV